LIGFGKFAAKHVDSMNVAIIGTGYVGLTTGVCLAYVGHSVTCLDADQTKIKSLCSGKIPIYEPFLDDLLAVAKPNLRFTTSYSAAIPGADVIFIAVGTPSMPSGSPDLQYLSQAAESIGEHLGSEFAVIVNKSTVPIGSGNWVGSLIRTSVAKRLGRQASEVFAVASNPEFLREGVAIGDTLYPDRIVIGSDEARALEVLYTLYRPIVDQTFSAPTFLPRPEGKAAVPLVSTDLASAELIKYAANAFLALKISFINEVGRVAERVGADIAEVARGIGLDSRIGPRFLSAGLGWGGSCFGKDTSALISTACEYGLTMPIVEAARQVNCVQRDRIIEKLQSELKILKGRTIALLGLAFKPNTDDLRDAPAIAIAEKLIGRGAFVKAHDPIAMGRFSREYGDMSVQLCEGIEEALADCDAVILATEWSDYQDLDWGHLSKLMRGDVVVDGRLVLDQERLKAAGLRYVPICG
jgi:UDPglucose 6-dehydrogenase